MKLCRYSIMMVLAVMLIKPVAAKEQVHFVMFGPNISETKTEVLSGLEPFVNWLNVRLSYELVPHFFKSQSELIEFLNTHPVGFALLDMSLYLEKKNNYGFVPMLKPVIKERDDYQVVVVARKKKLLSDYC